MAPLPRLLVTDLDNTLYDWVTYFSQAFYAMIDELVRIVPVEREKLLDEFRAVHRKWSNSEHPYAVLEIESVRRHFGHAADLEILDALDPALHAFNSARKRSLKLYDGVESTLTSLAAQGVTVVGHTEAVVPNAIFRLETLGIRPLLKHLYALEGPSIGHPRGGPQHATPPVDFIRMVPHTERKPNPSLLLDICAAEKISPADTWYVGDSLTRDMSMAKQAGVMAIWARYGTRVSKDEWARLVRITHWTDDDVRRESELKKSFADVKPDHTIDEFNKLLSVAMHD
jgi:phosphoglycolate phosphatase